MEQSNEPPILLFDGVCNLCSASVQWVLQRDKQAIFCFASLQSETGAALLRAHGLDRASTDSVVLVADGQAYVRSTAALEIARRLGWPWSMTGIFRILPLGLRDGIYDWVAHNRYRWFGKKEVCWMPQPEWKARFLE